MNRRAWLAGALATTTSVVLAGCQKVSTAPGTLRMLQVAEKWSKNAQRLLIGRHALAPEFSEADISPDFRANGTIIPPDKDYQALRAGGFADWRLVVDGLVETPLSLTMDQLRALPARTQITRHDCVEGWSSIAKWKGVPLATLLDQAKLKPDAKFIVFHCLDTLPGAAYKYYESIDLVDAAHPQTILAYDMNDQVLGVPHGAPLRLRVERQLGYKQAKYVYRIEAVTSFEKLNLGKGGFWEDNGYEWYAGIESSLGE